MSSRAKKMRLISDEEYKRMFHSSSSPSQTLPAQDMGGMGIGEGGGDELNITNFTKIPDDAKWKLYQQALHRMLDINDVAKKKPVKVRISNMPSLSDNSQQQPQQQQQNQSFSIFNAIPNFQRSTADSIKQFLESSNEINWNETTGQVSINNTPIVGSNIANLVRHCIRKLHKKPTGCDIFVKALSRTNIPTQVIGNSTIANLINKNRAVEQTASNHVGHGKKKAQIGKGKPKTKGRKSTKHSRGRAKINKQSKCCRWKPFR